MKILVTGGLGFIGSNFIRYWLSIHPGDDVTNLDNLTYAANPQSLSDLEKNPHYHFTKGDICDPLVVDRLVSENEIIIHFAAESHVDRSIDDPLLFVRTNVMGTYQLLSAAKKHQIKRFHHVSTDEVFGTIPIDSNEEFSEITPYDPSSPYSASKASSDHFVRAFYKTFKLPITITNCSNNYGPYQHPEKFIPRIITNLIDDKKIPVYGQGANLRDWLYVTDHCRAIETVVLNGQVGETYCVGGLKESTRNIDIVKMILKIFNKGEDQIEYVTDRPAHDNYAVSWDKINKNLNWEPGETLQSGLEKTVKWYQENESWWRPLKTEAEEFYKKLNNYNL